MEVIRSKPFIKRIKKIGFGLLLLMMCYFTPLKVYAYSQLVELNELVNQSSQYDGQVVHVKGEALLEALERKGYAWVNINDGTNAMGVVMPYEAVKKISQYGNYKQKGDVIEIEAVFHRSCIEHGGDMDLHFIKLLSVTKGEPILHKIGFQRIFIGILAIIATVLSIWGIKPSNSKE